VVRRGGQLIAERWFRDRTDELQALLGARTADLRSPFPMTPPACGPVPHGEAMPEPGSGALSTARLPDDAVLS